MMCLCTRSNKKKNMVRLCHEEKQNVSRTTHISSSIVRYELEKLRYQA